MGQVSGSFSSITRGVSEQVPHERRAGQHHEQVNMISDPVRGNARRHGSVMMDEKVFAAYNSSIYADTLADIKNFKTHTFFIGGVEYALCIRSAAKVGSSDAPVCWVYNKDSGAFLEVVLDSPDTVLSQLVSGGASAVVNTGRFVFIAGNTIVPALVETDVAGSITNSRRTAVWVRGGAYSRTFTVTFKMATGPNKVISYKTKASSYPGVLDTSGIAYSDPEYQKKVNDATSAYNTASTQWIGEAAADIQPDNIAQKLLDAATTAGLTGTRIGSHIVFDYTQNIVEVSVDDGGDGSFLRGVGYEVSSTDMVSNIHYVGKVVKVRPKNSDGSDAYYLKAYPKIAGTTGWAEVAWREAAGYEMQPIGVFIYGTVEGGKFYLSSTASGLEALTGVSNPGFEVNAVGDNISAPAPAFFGKKISYLGMFQDRLVIGADAVVFLSRPGDYLNWFRQSVLTVLDDDPVELFALGSEDDVITHGAIYDKNLFLFGKRKQYAIPGRTTITPKVNAIVPMSAFEDATDAAPVQTGNYVFYAKTRDSSAPTPSSSIYQLQIGVVADSPESYEISQQLDKYIVGSPAELVAITVKPHTLFVRTSNSTNFIYVYRYIDQQGSVERVWDSWSRWEWDEAVGSIAGMTEHNGDLIVFTVRNGIDKDGANKVWIVADRFTLSTALSDRPYLDSQRALPEFVTPVADTWLQAANAQAVASSAVAFDNTRNEFLLGTPAKNIADFIIDYAGAEAALWVGVQFPAYFTPTNPYIRDRFEKAILDGRLTVGRYYVTLANSGGCIVEVQSKRGTITSLKFNGRITGYQSSAIGRQPLVNETVTAGVMRETRECTVVIKANTWLPCTVSALSWRGQFFNNTRRV